MGGNLISNREALNAEGRPVVPAEGKVWEGLHSQSVVTLLVSCFRCVHVQHGEPLLSSTC